MRGDSPEEGQGLPSARLMARLQPSCKAPTGPLFLLPMCGYITARGRKTVPDFERMHEPPSVIDVATAVVVDGVLTIGNLSDPPVPWWSFSKTVIAAAALALVDAGRLALDAPLAGRRFTLRQLLQHRAGVPDYGWLKAYHEAVARGDTPWTVEELLERASAMRWAEPGAGFLYSNVGYLLVRQLIEDTTGKPLGDAVERQVFAPLGITDARFAATPAHLGATRWGNAGGYDPRWVYHGLIIGPPAAAALALDRLLHGNLLRPAALAAMQDGMAVADAPVAGRPWRAPGYGLGLMTERTEAKPERVGHSGQGPGSTAAVYHFPTRRPCITAAAFAPVDNEALVEHRAVEIARGWQG